MRHHQISHFEALQQLRSHCQLPAWDLRELVNADSLEPKCYYVLLSYIEISHWVIAT